MRDKHSTVRIPLSQNQVTIIDEADLPLIEGYKWSATRSRTRDGKRYKSYYARTLVKDPITGKQQAIRMHQLIIGAQPGEFVDHVNGNTLDNRRSNLRLATREQNGWNLKRPRTNRSGFKGVYFHKGAQKWYAVIRDGRRQRHLGTFDSPEQAALAYDDQARVLHGDYARLNFPREGEHQA